MRKTGRTHIATVTPVCFAAVLAVLATGVSAAFADHDAALGIEAFRGDEPAVGGAAWRRSSSFISVAPDAIMADVVTRVRATAKAGVRPVVVFDLDSTLFNNGPRNVRIAAEFAAANGGSLKFGTDARKLAWLRSENASFSLESMLGSVGIDVGSSRGKAVRDAYAKFWYPRFFADAYMTADAAYPNAAAAVRRVYHATDDLDPSARVLVVYLTGRHHAYTPSGPDDEFPAGMEQGTRAALVRDGIPTGDRTTLMMKDSWNEEDDVFKRRAATDIRARGRVVAAFDNEPANIAVFVEQFPDAMNVWVRTIDSGRPARPVRGVYTMGGGANDRADWPSDHRG